MAGASDAPKIIGALILIGSLLAFARTGKTEDKKPGELGPNDPAIEGATVVLNGLGKTPGGITVPWRIELLDDVFYGIVLVPWNDGYPRNVGQGPDKGPVQDAVLAWVSSQDQGLPG